MLRYVAFPLEKMVHSHTSYIGFPLFAPGFNPLCKGDFRDRTIQTHTYFSCQGPPAKSRDKSHLWCPCILQAPWWGRKRRLAYPVLGVSAPISSTVNLSKENFRSQHISCTCAMEERYAACDEGICTTLLNSELLVCRSRSGIECCKQKNWELKRRRRSLRLIKFLRYSATWNWSPLWWVLHSNMLCLSGISNRRGRSKALWS